VSVAAFCLSAFLALRSIRNDARTKKRVEFIELIAVEFGKIDASLDALEVMLKRASKRATIDSHEILNVALPAVRISGRALTAVSGMPAVSQDLVNLSGVDELDQILTMADDGAFDEATRSLHITTALNIVTRVAARCASTKLEVQSTHLN